MLAVMVAGHRRKLRTQLLDELPAHERAPLLKNTLLLRLSVILHRSRQENHLPSFLLEVDGLKVKLIFPADWLDNHPLTKAELQLEQDVWQRVGFGLEF